MPSCRKACLQAMSAEAHRCMARTSSSTSCVTLLVLSAGLAARVNGITADSAEKQNQGGNNNGQDGEGFGVVYHHIFRGGFPGTVVETCGPTKIHCCDEAILLRDALIIYVLREDITHQAARVP